MILGQVLPIPHIVFVIAFLKAKQKKKPKKQQKNKNQAGLAQDTFSGQKCTVGCLVCSGKGVEG